MEAEKRFHSVSIPEGRSGKYSIKRQYIDYLCGSSEPLGWYTVLWNDDIGHVMQDTNSEYVEHKDLFKKAHGDVLIGGLGIGFVHKPLIENKKVHSITVIEKQKDVINLVWDYCDKNNKIKLIHDDIENWVPDKKYNIAWFDTWLTNSSFSHDEYILYMKNKFQDSCDWIGFWRRSD